MTRNYQIPPRTVYQEQNGELLTSSSLFNLPSTSYETVLAEIEPCTQRQRMVKAKSALCLLTLQQ